MVEDRPFTYDFRSVEARWQQRWEAEGLYIARDDDPRPKFYVLEMLPYPSGDLHVGHAKNYTLGDAYRAPDADAGIQRPASDGLRCVRLARRKRRDRARHRSRRVDPPNIANMRRQIRLMGTGYDWSREFATCEPEYYRWNQWLFSRLFEDGLAYKREAPGQLVPQRSDRARQRAGRGRPLLALRSVVERRNLSQWFFKITEYADRLLAASTR